MRDESEFKSNPTIMIWTNPAAFTMGKGN